MPADPIEELLSEDQVMGLLHELLTGNEIVLNDEITVGNVTLTIASLDHEETETAMRACKSDDIWTRELSFKREALTRAITKINGKDVKPLVVDRFLRKSPPTLVNLIYTRFTSIGMAQDQKFAQIFDVLKKEQAST